MNKQNGFTKFVVFAKIFAKKHVTVWSLIMLTHSTLFYFWKKTNDKGNNKFNLLFSKIVCPHSCLICWQCVGVVVDCVDTSQNSFWRLGHNVCVVIEFADTVPAKLLTTWTQCRCSRSYTVLACSYGAQVESSAHKK